MYFMLTGLLGLGAFIWSFFSPIWAWLPIGVAALILVMTFLGTKGRKGVRQDELSPLANDMLEKYGHFYTMPYASRTVSSSSTLIGFIGIAVAIVGANQGFWWGIGIALFVYFLMHWVARSMNPTVFMKDPAMQEAHQEVIDWVVARNTRITAEEMGISPEAVDDFLGGEGQDNESEPLSE